MTLFRAIWLLSIALRFTAYRRTQYRWFALWLILSAIGESALFFINAMRWRCCYDYAWRAYTLASLVGLAAVVWEASEPHGKRLAIAASLSITAAVLFILHHHPVWPGFWLEPVFRIVTGVSCFLGLLIVLTRPTCWHGRILAAWLLGTAVLYSGAALSIERVGLAVEILDCVALGAWVVIGNGYS